MKMRRWGGENIMKEKIKSGRDTGALEQVRIVRDRRYVFTFISVIVILIMLFIIIKALNVFYVLQKQCCMGQRSRGREREKRKKLIIKEKNKIKKKRKNEKKK